MYGRLSALRRPGVRRRHAARGVMTPGLLWEVFCAEAEIVPDPRSGVPLCIPHGLCCPDNPNPNGYEGG